ncbi:MAG: DNA mismatch repair protein MutS [Oscillospiraceae bacterium]|jgi:DNA mismatch repair protein MutS|nr:DNA mismatch repair protein MutS [Oscillospiraceae bacterium]
MSELTPMMQQYIQIKQQNPNCILFYRLGDFYEMFFEDAKVASKELELVLTGRDCGLEERAPMCGVPYHSYENYAAKLISRGYKVAIVEQTEDPAVAKGLVRREVVRILTPGTVIEGSMLEEEKNNYLCSLFVNEEGAGLCFADVSTGEINLTQLEKKGLAAAICNELGRYLPKEIVLNARALSIEGLGAFLRERIACTAEILENSDFEYSHALSLIEASSTAMRYEHSENRLATSAFGALLSYVNSTKMGSGLKADRIEYYSENQFMSLDLAARRNLELTETMRSKEKRGSLLWVLDKTQTAMGKRLIRAWTEQPLYNCSKIIGRQNAVEELFLNSILRSDLSLLLSDIKDIERIMIRISSGTANGRELRALSSTIASLAPVITRLEDVQSKLLNELKNEIDPLADVLELIESSIAEEPPFTIREGGIIKEGYNTEIDLLREDMNGGKDFIARIEASERERTGIPKLKVGYNRVFGYYIEITNMYKDRTPAEYIRKQTLANCERYITQELKELEGRILGAGTKLQALEYQLFEQIRNKVALQEKRIQATAQAIAVIDVLCSLAEVSAKRNYTKPQITTDGRLILKDSRHPVLEAIIDVPFVANDVALDTNENRVAIITGPNMAGKSTYMRQTALIAIMAQMGCFVPARSAEIGLVDAVFTRIGASDDLTTGQSTFMVEMNEVANILKKATSKSLLILDEIGRGTSTFDGMSIARAVLEFVAEKRKLGAKTMFATHYHELTVLEQSLDGVKNYNIAVKKNGDDITFLRRIIRGGADDSYGIEVAKLAGLPNSVIARAKEILEQLEGGETVKEKPSRKRESQSLQMSLSSPKESAIMEKLHSIDVNTMTPMEAMAILFEISKLAKG